MLEYNPLLPINIQKTSDVSKSDIDKVESDILELQTSKITNAGKSAQASTDAKSIYVTTQPEYDALTTIVPDQLYFVI